MQHLPPHLRRPPRRQPTILEATHSGPHGHRAATGRQPEPEPPAANLPACTPGRWHNVRPGPGATGFAAQSGLHGPVPMLPAAPAHWPPAPSGDLGQGHHPPGYSWHATVLQHWPGRLAPMQLASSAPPMTSGPHPPQAGPGCSQHPVAAEGEGPQP